MGASDDAVGGAVGGRDEVLEHLPAGADATDLVGPVLREPEHTVGAGSDAVRGASLGEGELGEPTAGGDSPDLIGSSLGEPQRTIGADGNARGKAVNGRERVLCDLPTGGNAADPVGIEFREPQRTIRASDDTARKALAER